MDVSFIREARAASGSTPGAAQAQNTSSQWIPECSLRDAVMLNLAKSPLLYPAKDPLYLLFEKPNFVFPGFQVL
jgi:hypothetical protein